MPKSPKEKGKYEKAKLIVEKSSEEKAELCARPFSFICKSQKSVIMKVKTFLESYLSSK